MKSIKTNPNSVWAGKRLRMCEIVCWWRKHMAQIESWKNKHIDGFYTKTTQKGGFSKLCVKIKKRSRISSLSGRMHIARVNIGFFTGFKKIKQRRISFVLGYLRMILWTKFSKPFYQRMLNILNQCWIIHIFFAQNISKWDWTQVITTII
jgi:hypothetical protein